MRFPSIAFTGTRLGMTNAQLLEIHMLMGDLQHYACADTALHGMCRGADEQFHQQAAGFRYRTIGYPGVTKQGEPYCRADMTVDEQREEAAFLTRNFNLVSDGHLLLATPKEQEEVLKSGTWNGIRSATRLRRPACIIYPDGTSSVSCIPGVDTAERLRHELARLR